MSNKFSSYVEVRTEEVSRVPHHILEKKIILDFLKNISLDYLKKIVDLKVLDPEKIKIWESAYNDKFMHETLINLRNNGLIRYECELNI